MPGSHVYTSFGIVCELAHLQLTLLKITQKPKNTGPDSWRAHQQRSADDGVLESRGTDFGGGNEVDIQTEETYREHRGYILVAIDVSNCPFDVAKGNMWK